ncbi:MAG TPA: transglycosylase SLT domain-containing protein [Longimicrobiaceae bacterium]|jgi:soluble lytic murein transglycosylase|nr:transglycosylase SLT domain-containing protein [Longimicrobiaceae bacterium]
MTRRNALILATAVLLPVLIWGAARMSEGEARKPASAVSSAPAVSRAHEPEFPSGIPADVVALMRQGRDWAASRRMTEVLRNDDRPEAAVVAARAQAGWGGWSTVRTLLDGKPWLDTALHGEGWFLLARAYEEGGDWTRAAFAYQRYLKVSPEHGPGDANRPVAQLRYGLALLHTGQVEPGVAALERARAFAPAAAAWANLLAAEALADHGDTARVRALVESAGTGVPWLRAREAWVQAYGKAKDPRGQRSLALTLRAQAPNDTARAMLSADAGAAALAMGDSVAALGDFRAAMSAAPASPGAGAAATRAAGLRGLTAGDRLLLAQTFDRRGDNPRAAAGYRAWLASGSGTADERLRVTLALGKALFDSGRYADAQGPLATVASSSSGMAPEAMYVLGRAQSRAGKASAANATFMRLAARFPGRAEAANALYLVADAADDRGDDATARSIYARILSGFPGTTRAGQAMMRLGGASFAARDYAGAERIFEQYRAANPQGDAWLQATYWAGRAALARGDKATATQRFREVREREPVSYYSVRAAARLGEPYWPVELARDPADSAGVRARVDASIQTVDLLRDAGLAADAEQEAERLLSAAATDASLVYPLAEALAARGITVPAVHAGQAMQKRGVPLNARLLRILYPYPYRPVLEAEAKARGLDPFLVAALTRQESVFKAGISSPVGARGLMQVMPETGRGVAAGLGTRPWSADLLFDPEINVHLGTRFLAEQMRDYRGSLPSVFAAYNAGPARVERWSRFPEYRDEELFTERIPFDETREYVKILTRNIALYRGLYGG